jgi:hypothetical protein
MITVPATTVNNVFVSSHIFVSIQVFYSWWVYCCAPYFVFDMGVIYFTCMFCLPKYDMITLPAATANDFFCYGPYFGSIQVWFISHACSAGQWRWSPYSQCATPNAPPSTASSSHSCMYTTTPSIRLSR